MTALDALSKRELQVYEQIAAGVNPAVIAHRLCLSVKTVSTYRARVLEKLGIRGGNAGIATHFHAARLLVAEDHALVAAALCAGVARWEPFDLRATGELCVAGLRYCTKLDDHGVPLLGELIRNALIVAMPPKAMAA